MTSLAAEIVTTKVIVVSDQFQFETIPMILSICSLF